MLGKAYHTNVRFLGELRERLFARQIAVERHALLGLTRQVAEVLQEYQTAGRKAVIALAAHERRRWLTMFH